MPKYSIYIGIVIFVFAVIVSVIAVFLKIIEEKRRYRLKELTGKAKVEEGELERKYKGLILFVSLPPKEEKEEWINNSKRLIDNITSLNDVENLSSVFEIRGIGQTIKAIAHHLGELKYCWMIYSKESKDTLKVIRYFINKFANKTINDIPVHVSNVSAGIKEIKETVTGIYNDSSKDIFKSEIISDITGGTKAMTAGMVLACIPKDHRIEYVEQVSNNLIELKDITPDIVISI